ncbi:hypothetical protein LLEC1_05777 [Akanthomyces lecanii]|uniref:Uncharacterized protein n=1 Tax=Cordyceps confragosa TaxID=2714763 RepID=A0A179I7M2_CORDF|nr:hypothetical protein LLEC1_05777 [Akanthomyces lecanii]
MPAFLLQAATLGPVESGGSENGTQPVTIGKSCQSLFRGPAPPRPRPRQVPVAQWHSGSTINDHPGQTERLAGGTQSRDSIPGGPCSQDSLLPGMNQAPSLPLHQPSSSELFVRLFRAVLFFPRYSLLSQSLTACPILALSYHCKGSSFQPPFTITVATNNTSQTQAFLSASHPAPPDDTTLINSARFVPFFHFDLIIEDQSRYH